MFEEIEKSGCAAGGRLGGSFRGCEIASAQCHHIGARALAYIDDNHGTHSVRELVVVLEKSHQREVPAVENVEHRIRPARLGVVLRQGNEKIVLLPDFLRR